MVPFFSYIFLNISFVVKHTCVSCSPQPRVLAPEHLPVRADHHPGVQGAAAVRGQLRPLPGQAHGHLVHVHLGHPMVRHRARLAVRHLHLVRHHRHGHPVGRSVLQPQSVNNIQSH